jgi:hypothetical protein
MARNHARLFASTWNDEDFLALPPRPQRMYMFLISQQDLLHCGVIALRERRWSRGAAGLTVADVRADLEVLAEHRFVVIDDEAEELLVRSLMRRDKVYAQPNVFKAAAEQIRAVSSPAIKAVLVDELCRLPVAELKGDVRKVYEQLLADLTAGSGGGTPSPTPSRRGSATPSGSPPGALPGPGEASGDRPTPALRAVGGEANAFPQDLRGSLRGSGTPSKGVPSEPRGKGKGNVGDIATDRTSVEHGQDPREPDPPSPAEPVAVGDGEIGTNGVLIDLPAARQARGRPSPKPGSDDDPDWRSFWDAYPRKVSKGHARAAWAKAVTRASPGQLVKAAEAYRDDPARPRDHQYIPHPATWLNGDRWLDEQPRAADRIRPGTSYVEIAPPEFNP